MPAQPISLTPPDPPLIELKDVHKIFRTTAGEFHALKGINLQFQRGDFAAIMGKSGSGKSTLLNMLTGIDHPTSGTVRVGESELHRMNEGQLAVWRGRAMGIVFQFFQLLPTLSTLENTILPMDYASRYPLAEREEHARALLRMLELEEFADKLPAALSGGQQQIAAIARSMANDPPIIVADEPTGNLDSRTAEIVMRIFADLAAQGKTILIVTHDPTLAARAARRILISDGELINEAIADALPMLSHPQMLDLTKQVTLRRYDPSAIVVRQGAMDEGLYIVQSGEIDVLQRDKQRQIEKIATLGRGQYISNLEMVEADDCDLTCQVTEGGPVEMLCLTLGQFGKWLSENVSAEKAMRELAQQRANQLCGREVKARSQKSSHPHIWRWR